MVRVAAQVLSAALGGAQSIHSNGFDEALALPTEESAKLALRTQQVIAAESGIVDTVDPLGGSYAVETLTAEIEDRARELIAEIDERGGAVECIEYMRDADRRRRLPPPRGGDAGRAGGGRRQRVPRGRRAAGVRSTASTPRSRSTRSRGCAELRARRDNDAATRALDAVRAAAKGTANLLHPMREALRARATVGEVCGVLRDEFGEYDRVRAAES